MGARNQASREGFRSIRIYNTATEHVMRRATVEYAKSGCKEIM